ncbi:MAG: hypothetical protein CVT63_02610 [Candidatus Anoxymicrobium japonicum]|uniref:DUF4349 domain-containing protein n=1 Tax=Candidatus Anoxymicrobium japonicum TaxID=2013648 RepID=A0A2N3G6V5_9ACTN|nr:MAG: hypothetical protein CVT63_02610 [Candidatus Anoxymicrobium japonicum]
MEEKQKNSTILKKTLAIGGGALIVLLILLAIGFLTGAKKDSGERAISLGDGGSSQGDFEPRAKSMNPGEAAPDEVKSERASLTTIPGISGLDIKMIKTGSLSLEIKKGDFNEAYAKVSFIAEGAGGAVSESNSESSKGRITGGTITIRVPNSVYPKVMEQLKKLGKVIAAREQSQDVTEEYVDLDSRIRNLNAQQQVYLGLMAKATTIEQGIAVQHELASVEEQIETLTGRKNYLDNHVQFSTIAVVLAEPGRSVSAGEEWGFAQALRDAAHNVVDGVNAVVRFLGAALVYALIIGAFGLLAYQVARKRAKA